MAVAGVRRCTVRRLAAAVEPDKKYRTGADWVIIFYFFFFIISVTLSEWRRVGGERPPRTLIIIIVYIFNGVGGHGWSTEIADSAIVRIPVDLARPRRGLTRAVRAGDGPPECSRTVTDRDNALAAAVVLPASDAPALRRPVGTADGSRRRSLVVTRGRFAPSPPFSTVPGPWSFGVVTVSRRIEPRAIRYGYTRGPRNRAQYEIKMCARRLCISFVCKKKK